VWQWLLLYMYKLVTTKTMYRVSFNNGPECEYVHLVCLENTRDYAVYCVCTLYVDTYIDTISVSRYVRRSMYYDYKIIRGPIFSIYTNPWYVYITYITQELYRKVLFNYFVMDTGYTDISQ